LYKDVANYRTIATNNEHTFALKAFKKTAKCSRDAVFAGPSAYDVVYGVPCPVVYNVRPCPLPSSSSQGGENAHCFSAFADQQQTIMV
jgi:hypothetical protein